MFIDTAHCKVGIGLYAQTLNQRTSNYCIRSFL